jgi:hypothetical protein
MCVRRGPKGSSHSVVDRLNRTLLWDQRLVYLKHNTLIGEKAYWTAIVENPRPMVMHPAYRSFSPVFKNFLKQTSRHRVLRDLHVGGTT